MALPLRLLGRLTAGVGGRRLPPPLAVLHHHLSASDPNPTTHAPLPLPPRVPLLPFAVPARSFSWYSRSSPPGPGAADKATYEDVHAVGEGVCLHDAGSVDYGGVVASAAGASADAVDNNFFVNCGHETVDTSSTYNTH